MCGARRLGRRRCRLLEEGCLVREEGVAGRLEVVGGTRLRVSEPAGARRSLNAGSTAIFSSAVIRRNAIPFERPTPGRRGSSALECLLHGLDPVQATIFPATLAWTRHPFPRSIVRGRSVPLADLDCFSASRPAISRACCQTRGAARSRHAGGIEQSRVPRLRRVAGRLVRSRTD